MTKEHPIPLVHLPIQDGTPVALVYEKSIFSTLSFREKIKFKISGKINFSDKKIHNLVKSTFQDTFFGYDDDYGEELYWLIFAHCHEKWSFSHLTENDHKKIRALEASSIIAQQFPLT